MYYVMKIKKNLYKKKINECKNVFDVTLVGDCDYSPIIELLKKMKEDN